MSMGTEAKTEPCGLDLRWNGYWGEQPTGTACGEPANATVSIACVHEHLDTVRICWGCASDMQQTAGTITCKRCWNSEKSHACHCLVVIDWDSGEKTIVQEPPRA